MRFEAKEIADDAGEMRSGHDRGKRVRVEDYSDRCNERDVGEENAEIGA